MFVYSTKDRGYDDDDEDERVVLIWWANAHSEYPGFSVYIIGAVLPSTGSAVWAKLSSAVDCPAARYSASAHTHAPWGTPPRGQLCLFTALPSSTPSSADAHGGSPPLHSTPPHSSPALSRSTLHGSRPGSQRGASSAHPATGRAVCSCTHPHRLRPAGR